MIKSFDPFSVPFVLQHYDDKELNSKLAEVLLRVDREYTGKRPRGMHISGMQTAIKNLLDEDPIMKEFEQMLISGTDKFFEINNKLIKPSSITFQSWGNIIQGNEYHDVHGHSECKLVINYYIRTPKGTKVYF